MIRTVYKQWWSWCGNTWRRWRLGSSWTRSSMWPAVVTGSISNSSASRQSNRSRRPQADSQRATCQCPSQDSLSSSRPVRLLTSSSRSPTASRASWATQIGTLQRCRRWPALEWDCERRRPIWRATADNIRQNRLHLRLRLHSNHSRYSYSYSIHQSAFLSSNNCDLFVHKVYKLFISPL